MKTVFSSLFSFIGAVLFMVTPLSAQIITLQSNDGSITLTGELLAFDGVNYTIVSAIGEMTIPVASVNCEGEACPDPISSQEEFMIAGSSVIAEALLPALIEAYALERGGDLQVEFGGNGAAQFYVIDADGSVYSTITLNSGGSDTAFAALLDGSAAFGVSSRPASDLEVQSFAEQGLGNLNDPTQEKIIALDGVVAVVHPDNPVKSLSLSQIAQIFAGEISNWSQLGGLNNPVALYRRDENMGTTSVFGDLIMVDAGDEAEPHNFAKTATILPTGAAVADAVSRDPNGIGISAFADTRNARALAIRAVCGQLSTASKFTIKTEEYQMSRRMFLYTSAAVRPDRANEFINFLSSPTAQLVVENAGFIGQNVTSLSLDQQGRRIANAVAAANDVNALANLQNLLTTMLDAKRLSFTFRFNNGSSTLDNRALGDIARLAAMIKDGAFANQQILVVGFTDKVGSDDESAVLSQAWAEQVQAAILNAAQGADINTVRITPVGFGNIAPLGCNETNAGRETNRRVEIWVR